MEKILARINMLCPCCMEQHEVRTVEVQEQNIFKGVHVRYKARYFYCDQAEEYYTDEEMLRSNDISMKNAYRRNQGLLTSDEISGIREKYGISQSDLCRLLGWGGKTITRYEGHQIQDYAHDTILRKLGNDPEWFLSLLENSKDAFANRFIKYYDAAAALFEKEHDAYLRKSILSRYAGFRRDPVSSGNTWISLDTVIDAIRYFSNSAQVTNLYKVKLMKLLWYSDALSYKRRGHAITGLVYQALPMGAVPIAHDSIIDLNGIQYEEIDMGDNLGYRFKETKDKEYKYLTEEDKEILDNIIHVFGRSGTSAIVEAMHREQAYIKTIPRGIIKFEYAKTLSIT